MSVKLAGIKLKNYCGYRDSMISFLDEYDDVRKVSVLYGPNGIGKSTLLESIGLVSNPYLYAGRDCRLAFQKITYHHDYNPYNNILTSKKFLTKQDYDRDDIIDNDSEVDPLSLIDLENIINDYDLEVEGVFKKSDKYSSVIFNGSGLVRSDIPKKSFGYSCFLDADNPIHMSKFQVDASMAEVFLDMAESIYGYNCGFNMDPVTEGYKDNNGNLVQVDIFTDFVLEKNGTITHFKTMSDGEKKIATLLAMLCDPYRSSNTDIFVVDNFTMHAYFLRHVEMLEKVLEHFPDKQFILADHSPLLIEHIYKKYGSDACVDIEAIKNNTEINKWLKRGA